jgi:hypothetical protein
VKVCLLARFPTCAIRVPASDLKSESPRLSRSTFTSPYQDSKVRVHVRTQVKHRAKGKVSGNARGNAQIHEFMSIMCVLWGGRDPVVRVDDAGAHMDRMLHCEARARSNSSVAAMWDRDGYSCCY